MRRLLLLLALTFPLSTACGSGGGTQVAGGGIGGTGLSSGSVTGFGSFFVTGTEWVLDAQAEVELDGESGDAMGAFGEDDLALGMYLRVEGRRSDDGTSGNATRVVYDEAIRGAVEQMPFDLAPDRKTFSVLGQAVVIDDGLTIFGGTTFLDLSMDDVVEVSGPVESDGTIRATRLDKLGTLVLGTSEVEFKGVVADFTPGAPATFDVGPVEVSVDCAGFTDCSALPNGLPPSNGDRVEIEGVQTGAGMTPEVDALVVRPFTPFASAIGDVENLALEGVMDDFMTLGDFTVNGVRVDASGAVLDPADPALYRDGTYVDVEGDVVNGTLVARKLELEDGEARVDAQIPSGGLDRVGQGEIVLLAEPGQQLVVRVDAATRLEDDSNVGDPDLQLGELLVGDFLEVRGVDLGGGVLRATEVERDEIDDVELRGRVESVDTNTDGGVGFTVLGIYVELVQDVSSVPGSNVASFLAGLPTGTLVKARDDQDGSEQTFDIADEVELLP